MANTKITADNLAANAVTASSIADNSIGITQLNVSDGTNGQVLTTNGSGTLSFGDIPAGYTDSDVETYLNTSAIYTDPTNNRLGIGTSSPAKLLSLSESADGTKLRITRGGVSEWDFSIGNTSTLTGVGSGALELLPQNTNTANEFAIGTAGSSAPLFHLTNSQAYFAGNLLVGGTSTSVWQGAAGKKFIVSGSQNTVSSLQTSSTATDQGGIYDAYSTAVTSGSPALGSIAFLRSNTSTTACSSYTGFYTNNAGSVGERMRIDSAGRLLVNKTSGSGPLHVKSISGSTTTAVFEALDGNNFDVQLHGHSYYGGITFYSDFYGSNTKYGEINQYINGGMYYTSTNGGHVFICNTNNSVNETMRLNGADGVLLVNRSTRFGAGGSDAMIVTGGTDAAIRVTGPNTSSYKWIEFYNGSLNQIGSISNNSNTNTSFNTSSDYRLKENINDVWEATPLLKQLRPVEFNWIADETDELHHGFIAHEVDAILPFTVTGEKDAMTEPVYYVEADQEVMEGTVEAGDLKEEAKIQPQQMDYAKVVPLLVKTIQELEARITELENA